MLKMIVSHTSAITHSPNRSQRHTAARPGVDARLQDPGSFAKVVYDYEILQKDKVTVRVMSASNRLMGAVEIRKGGVQQNSYLLQTITKTVTSSNSDNRRGYTTRAVTLNLH